MALVETYPQRHSCRNPRRLEATRLRRFPHISWNTKSLTVVASLSEPFSAGRISHPVREDPPHYSTTVPTSFKHYPFSSTLVLRHACEIITLALLEGLIFPSVLLANTTLRLTVLPHSRALPNIVLHFLGNGLISGEVIRPVHAGEAPLLHWSLGREMQS